MSISGRPAWDVETPGVDDEPYLAATKWLLGHRRGALIVGPEAGESPSVHARTLLEGAPSLDPRHPGPRAHKSGLGVVLVQPNATQFEALNRKRFDARTTWYLVPSEPGDARAVQEAWLWAVRRPGPRLRRGDAAVRALDADPMSLLSDIELWALALRAGRTPHIALPEHA
ncbi:MAG TPA: hypothetical protein VGC05_04350 [Mycobacterium sp.]